MTLSPNSHSRVLFRLIHCVLFSNHRLPPTSPNPWSFSLAFHTKVFLPSNSSSNEPPTLEARSILFAAANCHSPLQTQAVGTIARCSATSFFPVATTGKLPWPPRRPCHRPEPWQQYLAAGTMRRGPSFNSPVPGHVPSILVPHPINRPPQTCGSGPVPQRPRQ